MTTLRTVGPVRWLFVGVVVAAVLVGLGPGASLARSAQPDTGSPFELFAQQVDADAVLLSVDIRADGSGRWRIEYRVRLDDDNTTAAFEDLQAAVSTNASAYRSRFVERLSPTVRDAATSTGREMQLRDVSVNASIQQLPQSYGVLAYRFEWTNFAAVREDQLRAGDALAGLFLDADSALLFSWPTGYAVVDVSPPPTETRERSVVWRGPTDFGQDEPELVLSETSEAGGVDTSFVGVGIVGLVIIGGGIVWWFRRRARRAGPEPGAPEPAAGAPSTELLSNEERVIALLEEHGGRLKQQEVVEALGWTDAKTSQVVGKLRESGELEGFRLGRENVLRLPDVDESGPTDAGEPAAEDDRA